MDFRIAFCGVSAPCKWQLTDDAMPRGNCRISPSIAAFVGPMIGSLPQQAMGRQTSAAAVKQKPPRHAGERGRKRQA